MVYEWVNTVHKSQEEGRKNHAELRPQVVAEAKRLRRKRPKGGQRSYRQIAAELFQGGHCNSNGRAFSPSSIKAMLWKWPRKSGRPRSFRQAAAARAQDRALRDHIGERRSSGYLERCALPSGSTGCAKTPTGTLQGGSRAAIREPIASDACNEPGKSRSGGICRPLVETSLSGTCVVAKIVSTFSD